MNRDTLSAFKSRLKTHLFNIANCSASASGATASWLSTDALLLLLLPRFLSECHIRQLNQGSFVVLSFAFFFSGLCSVYVVCLSVFNPSSALYFKDEPT